MEQDIQTINKKPIIIGIAGLLLFLFAYTLIVYFNPMQHLDSASMKWRWIGTRLFFWGLLAALVLYSTKIEHRSILGIPQKRYSWKFCVVATIIMFVIIATGSGILSVLAKLVSKNQVSQQYATMKSLFQQNPSLILLTSVTAGVTEEYFFRGYLQHRLTLLSNKYVGIIVSALLFGLLHYNYGTLMQILFPFYLGIIFSLFYEKYRNINFLIVFHSTWDLIALYSIVHFKLPYH